MPSSGSLCQPLLHRAPIVETERTDPSRAVDHMRGQEGSSARAIVFIPFSGAVAEASSFPHEPRCVHCKMLLRTTEARWGTGLCDGCYGKCRKMCRKCNTRLPMQVLHWNSGLCNGCYDALSTEPLSEGFDMGVRMCIMAQLVFYMAPAVMQPSLYLEVQRTEWLNGNSDAAGSYAVVLTTATVVAMAAPLPFGYWAERRGEREIYFGVTIAATIAAMLLAFAPEIRSPVKGVGIATFAGAWGTLSAPLSLRGVRAAYFARRVAPSDLSRAGQLASAAGLVGSVAGPLLAALSRNAFVPAAIMAAIAHAVAAAALYAYLPAPAGKTTTSIMDGSDSKNVSTRQIVHSVTNSCERCSKPLTENERRYGTMLCNQCWDTWFRNFKRRALFAFCAVAAMLELSMNAAIVAPFQPIAVEQFGWGSDLIAKVNLLSAALSVLVSLAVAHFRLNEWFQVLTASGLYVMSTILFAWPPLAEWRLVVALVLGLKAQILFMAPFTAAFSRLIGGTRVTNGLTTALCLAPLMGAALGTAVAPLLIPFTGTPLFLMTSLPAIIALLMLFVGWRVVVNKDAKLTREHQGEACGRNHIFYSSKTLPIHPPWKQRLEGAAKSKPVSPYQGPAAANENAIPEAHLDYSPSEISEGDVENRPKAFS